MVFRFSKRILLFGLYLINYILIFVRVMFLPFFENYHLEILSVLKIDNLPQLLR